MKTTKTLFAILSIIFLASCSSSRISIDKRNLIDVSINLNNVIDDKVQVEVTPKKITENTIIYKIPAIVPGTYRISNYGKFISNFKAYDYNGNELGVQKLDTNSWYVDNAKNLDRISYWVDDTFDSDQEHNIYPMGGTNIEKDKNFFLNLPGFIGYFKGKGEVPYQINVTHPAHLYESSSLINKNTTKTDNTKDVFLASRYDEISDNPIMYAPLNNVSFNISGIEVNLAVYSPNNIHAAQDMEEGLKKMVKAQTNFLRGFKTTNEYNILLYLFDPKIYSWNSFGALEHLSSTTVVYPESYTKEKLLEDLINRVVAHEFFHIVTPLSVHSEEIHSFDFSKPNMSKHLWMYEGLTEYFAILFQVNQDLITEEKFINLIDKKIQTSLRRYNDTLSFTNMSKNILEPKYTKNYANVYSKGALIGMSLDILLREESNGQYGVRNMMLDLSKKYGREKAFKDDEIIPEIIKMTYPSVGEFFINHVQGNIPINYETVLNKVGLVKKIENVDTRYFIDNSNYAVFSTNKKGELFFKRTNSGLVALGVKKGDIIKKINNDEITSENATDIIIKTFDWKPGDNISIEIVRDGKILKFEGTAINAQVEEKRFVVEDLPADNPKTKLRSAWLKG